MCVFRGPVTPRYRYDGSISRKGVNHRHTGETRFVPVSSRPPVTQRSIHEGCHDLDDPDVKVPWGVKTVGVQLFTFSSTPKTRVSTRKCRPSWEPESPFSTRSLSPISDKDTTGDSTSDLCSLVPHYTLPSTVSSEVWDHKGKFRVKTNKVTPVTHSKNKSRAPTFGI